MTSNEAAAAAAAAVADSSAAAAAALASASAAAASLKRSLTERETARRVQMITAHARNGQLPDDLDWRALADRKATTIVYMGVRTLQALADRLCAEGLDPETPAVIIERASWPE
jgi:uroporphyrin-III C-methyltransferase/precorrin-2 dehydrogenase/sirohydrochlorin ferrochelatase